MLPRQSRRWSNRQMLLSAASLDRGIPCCRNDRGSRCLFRELLARQLWATWIIRHKRGKQVAKFVNDRIMSEVKADDTQKLLTRGIADAAASDLMDLATQHRVSHKVLVAILSEPTLDRVKLEALRSQTVRSLDESSKRISVVVADLADVLTPAQRLQLADRIERKHGFHISE